MKAKEIEKDTILDLKFPDTDVLNSDIKRSSRWLTLKKASHGWDTPKSEKNIIFKSEKQGTLSVVSSVIKTQSKYVILSGGYVIPMRSIYEVQ